MWPLVVLQESDFRNRRGRRTDFYSTPGPPRRRRVVRGAHAILPGVWTGLVFAGGSSERMGRDKALVRLAGRTLLERAVATIHEAGGMPVVLGARREASGLDGVRFADD